MEKNSRDKNQQPDFVGPLAEMLQDFVEVLADVLKVFCKYLWRKLTEVHFERKGIYRYVPLEQKKLKSRREAREVGEMGFSVTRKRPLSFKEIDFRRHAAVIGSTGSGKSLCLENLMTHSLMSSKPILYFDSKPSVEGIKRFRGLCQQFGKKAYVVSDVERGSVAFNPLLEGSAHDITSRIMAALEWSSVDLDNKIIRITKSFSQRLRAVKSTKNADWRNGYISPDLENVLIELKNFNLAADYVLPRLSGWDHGMAGNILRDFLKSIGIEKYVNFHTLRACFATHVLASGAEPTQVMKMGGWADFKTFQIYVRMAGVDVKGVTDNLKVMPKLFDDENVLKIR